MESGKTEKSMAWVFKLHQMDSAMMDCGRVTNLLKDISTKLAMENTMQDSGKDINTDKVL